MGDAYTKETKLIAIQLCDEVKDKLVIIKNDLKRSKNYDAAKDIEMLTRKVQTIEHIVTTTIR